MPKHQYREIDTNGVPRGRIDILEMPRAGDRLPRPVSRLRLIEAGHVAGDSVSGRHAKTVRYPNFTVDADYKTGGPLARSHRYRNGLTVTVKRQDLMCAIDRCGSSDSGKGSHQDEGKSQSKQASFHIFLLNERGAGDGGWIKSTRSGVFRQVDCPKGEGEAAARGSGLRWLRRGKLSWSGGRDSNPRPFGCAQGRLSCLEATSTLAARRQASPGELCGHLGEQRPRPLPEPRSPVSSSFAPAAALTFRSHRLLLCTAPAFPRPCVSS